MTQSRARFVVAGLMLTLFLVSMESTVVSTGMPTIVAQLGGLESYSWVFTAYMLTSTTTVPLYGKLSDLYGRRPVYSVAMVIFLVGSVLCGVAQSMPQLIGFRAVQGLGAGALLPLTFIMIGDLFSLEQRARIQGLFSGVWGVSSLAGPLLGGLIVDRFSWQWIFLINVVPVLIAWWLVWSNWADRERSADAPRPSVDYLGAALLTSGAVALLLGLSDLSAPWAWGAIGAAGLLLAALAFVELRVADPVLPVGLFRERMFAVACGHGLLAGCAVFGSLTFVPLFVQSVLGTSATQAGASLTPMLLAWVFSSIIGTRLLLRVGYRAIALTGTALVTVGSLALTQISAAMPLPVIILLLSFMGLGMGLCVPAFLIAVQSAVDRTKLGTATSTLTFSRTIGGALGTGIMGAVLIGAVASRLSDGAISLDGLLEGTGTALDPALRDGIVAGTSGVFVVAAVTAVGALAVTLLAPSGRVDQLQARRDAREAVVRPSAAGE
jgi:EmrB/QacA subfamily drug resistance transporter